MLKWEGNNRLILTQLRVREATQLLSRRGKQGYAVIILTHAALLHPSRAISLNAKQRW